MEKNELITNLKAGKTECMTFGTHQKVKKATDLVISYKSKSINSTTKYKYLGVNLDPSLRLSDHCSITYKKACGRLYLLQRLRPHLTMEAALAIYQTMLLPLFTYCSIITLQTSNTYKRKIQSFEERAHKIIKPATVLPKIDEVTNKKVCINMYKCLKGDTCEFFQDYFQLMRNNTRNNGQLIRIPKIRLESSKKAFFFYGATAFNDLPLETRSAQSLKDFLTTFPNQCSIHSKPHTFCPSSCLLRLYPMVF